MKPPLNRKEKATIPKAVRERLHLKPVPRFEVQTLAYGFGDCGFFFSVEGGFHEHEILHSLHSSKSKDSCCSIFLTSPTILILGRVPGPDRNDGMGAPSTPR